METEQKLLLTEPTSSGRTSKRVQRTESERREWYLERRRIWARNRRQNLSIEERQRNAERACIRRQKMSPEEKEKVKERRRQREAVCQQKKRRKQESEEQKDRRREKDRLRQQKRKEKDQAKILTPIEELEMEQKRLKIKERRKNRDRMQRESMSVAEWEEMRRKINEKRRAKDALLSKLRMGSSRSPLKRIIEKTVADLALNNHNNNCSGNNEEVNDSSSNQRTRAIELRRKARTSSDLLITEDTDRSDDGDISKPAERIHLEGYCVENEVKRALDLTMSSEDEEYDRTNDEEGSETSEEYTEYIARCGNIDIPGLGALTGGVTFPHVEFPITDFSTQETNPSPIGIEVEWEDDEGEAGTSQAGTSHGRVRGKGYLKVG
ncbi:hypothetical protein GIB67_002202, partial [Kingdonia uniflora]